MTLNVIAPQIRQYPLIQTRGDAHDRGVQYGCQARQRLLNTLRTYGDLFLAYAELDWAAVRRYATAYAAIIEDYDESLVEEMRGIAEGAQVDFEDILAINVRTEVMFGLGDMRAAADCTAFAALPEATESGHTLLGQNWDWNPAAFDSCVVLAMEQPDCPSIVTVVEAGLLAKMGMNSEGIGVVTNAMVSDADKGAPGIPYHIMLRSILNAATFDEAQSMVSAVDRASSANYLVGSSQGCAVDLEVAPGGRDRAFVIEPHEGLIGHANWFVSPESRVIKDQTAIKKPLSIIRQVTIDAALEGNRDHISVELMQSVLSGHENRPNSLCRHPLEELPPIDRSATVASVIMDLDSQTFWVADGQPCNHPYRMFTPADLWAACD